MVEESQLSDAEIENMLFTSVDYASYGENIFKITKSITQKPS